MPTSSRFGSTGGRQEGARETVLRITRTMLVQRFGENPRIDAAAERLAGLPDEERLTSIATATILDDLLR